MPGARTENAVSKVALYEADWIEIRLLGRLGRAPKKLELRDSATRSGDTRRMQRPRVRRPYVCEIEHPYAGAIRTLSVRSRDEIGVGFSEISEFRPQ